MSLLDQKLSRRRFVQTTIAAGVALYLADNVIERVDAMADWDDPERFVERPFQIALDKQMIPLTWRVTLRPDDIYNGVSPNGGVGGYWTTFLGPNGEEFEAVFDHRYSALHDGVDLGPGVIRPADVGILVDPIGAVIQYQQGLKPDDLARVRVEDVQIVRRDGAGSVVSGMFTPTSEPMASMFTLDDDPDDVFDAYWARRHFQ